MAHITSTLNWSSAIQFLEHEDAIKIVTEWIIQFLSEAAKNNVLESWDNIIDALSPKHTQVCSVYYFNISSRATASDAGTMEHTTYHLIPRALWYAVEQNDVHNPPLPPSLPNLLPDVFLPGRDVRGVCENWDNMGGSFQPAGRVTVGSDEVRRTSIGVDIEPL